MNTVERVVAMYRDHTIKMAERRDLLRPLMDRLSEADRTRIYNQVSIILTALSREDDAKKEQQKEKAKTSRAKTARHHTPTAAAPVTMEEFVAMNSPTEGLQ